MRAMKLCELYPRLTREERAELATKSGTDEGYLWQIATRWRGRKPSLQKMQLLAAADSRLTLPDLIEEFTATPAGAAIAPPAPPAAMAGG